MSRLILDAGAFVGYEKGSTRVRGRIAAARLQQIELVTSSPIVAQVWRDGRKQALLARLITATRIVSPDEVAARRAGELLARTSLHDAVDALLVTLARAGDTIYTSDPEDISTLVQAAGVAATVLTI